MDSVRILYSLHRPFHKPLKATKWVCLFVNQNTKKGIQIKPSEFYNEFFFFLIKTLNTEYKKNKNIENQDGIPNKETISLIVEYFRAIPQINRSKKLKELLSQRIEDLDKKIYSTYKAASYYINLCKDKFDLIDENNKLTKLGRNLIVIRAPFFKISNSEKVFFFERIISADFLMTISLCLSLRSIHKYKELEIEDFHLQFIEEFYKINFFKYIQKSISSNYDNVRLFWINSLDILDKSKKIKKKFLYVIQQNEEYNNLYNILENKYIIFEKTTLLKNNKRYVFFSKFEKTYQRKIKEGIHDLEFVNLYDIKREFKMSYEIFNTFLNDYYEERRKKKMILFSNTVSSIDKRERFFVKNIPVIKIKIH